MIGIIGKLVRVLVYTAATGVILLALFVGALRLLLPLVPTYQQEIRRIATDAIGLEVEFQRISASWPLRGPELQLFDVRLSDRRAFETVMTADEVAVGLSLVRLLTDQVVTVDYVGVNGARVDVQRLADGSFLVQGRDLNALLPANTAGEPVDLPQLDVEVEDLAFAYRDEASDIPPLEGMFERLRLELDPAAIMADGRVELTGVSSGTVEVALDLTGRLSGHRANPAEVGWDFAVNGEDLILPPLLSLATRQQLPFSGARGDLVLAGRMRGLQPQSILAEVSLTGVAVGTTIGEIEVFDRVAGNFEWERRANGWLIAANELRLGRDQQLWPRSSLSLAVATDGQAGLRNITAEASFLRLQDVYAILNGLATDQMRRDLLPAAVTGDVRNFTADINLAGDTPARYNFALAFDQLGVREFPGGLTAAGLSGTIAGDQDGGRLELDTAGVEIALPQVFLRPITADALSGLLVWRVTTDGVRVLSDSFAVETIAGEASSRFEFSLPRAGGGMRLDLDASVRAGEAINILDYLPLRRFPPDVTRWLQRAITAGRVPEARIRFRGPLREFPYDHGEGLFRVDMRIEDGRLDFANRWPVVESLAGDFVFDGISFYSRSNSGRLGGLNVRDVEVRIDDLRRGVLDIAGQQRVTMDGLFGFLRASPLAEQLGDTFRRATATGPVAADLSMRLPLARLRDYELRANFDLEAATLGLEGLAFGFSDIQGRVTLDKTRLSADSLEAMLLGEAVTAKLRPTQSSGSRFSHYVLVEGSNAVQSWADALNLPLADRLTGSASWRAMAMIPQIRDEASAGLHLLLRSDLQGVGSDFPAPLEKAADSVAPLYLDLGFGRPGVIDVLGRWRDDLHWALRLQDSGGRWELERGLVNAGGDRAELPAEPGLQLRGRLARFSVANWIELTRAAQQSGGGGLFGALQQAELQADELVLFGQLFRESEIAISRAGSGWLMAADGEGIRGSAGMPLDFDRTEPWQIDLRQLWLRETAAGDGGSMDPRALPPLQVAVQDFRIGEINFGQLNMEIRPGIDGVTASPLEINGDSFTISGDGAWLVVGNDVQMQRSRLRARLVSTDVEDTLQRLGYEPVIESDSAEAVADISWPGSPDAEFLARASGDFSIEFGAGSLLQLDAGGGRLLGVLSIASLPRRLSLDFRDVFDEGFGFDFLRGDFTLDDGNAYTCNLGLEGSVADMGVVGRTGLGARDYDQLAVVRPHVSNLMIVGGFAAGGPVGGAAAAVFSQIFKKPLSELGESYWQIKGPWETAGAERLARADVDTSRFSACEKYLAEILPAPVDADDMVTEPGTELPEEIVP
ncbi:MAG: YhdP family protein [Gammaproteobacteria bacterium]|nr:YhdP family protein [Gammaproteobacteria bacterium]